MVGTKIQLGISDLSRTVAETPDVPVLNRYFEQDPTNLDNQVDLLVRPGLIKWLELPTSPVRNTYSQPGTFSEGLFAVSGDTVYKIAQDETVTAIGTLGTSTGYVSMTATDTYLFLADGAALYYYTEDDYAKGTLTVSGAISTGETVVLNGVYYKFIADISADADGTSTAPWLVYLGPDAASSLQNLADAINNSGTAGTQYSIAMVQNADISAVSNDATHLTVRATLRGTDGNAYTTTETMATGSWSGATLLGGGGTTFGTVPTPDNVGIISVGTIISFVICVVAQGQNLNGRFYWIEPGENVIDALNFATAERSPDPVWDVIVSNDQFWLPGSSTIEVWYPTGDGDAPFQRQAGRLFERGAWRGSVVSIGETMMLIDPTGYVWEVTDQPRIVSTPGITERIRKAINAGRAV